jgi:hypothetical protein
LNVESRESSGKKKISRSVCHFFLPAWESLHQSVEQQFPSSKWIPRACASKHRLFLKIQVPPPPPPQLQSQWLDCFDIVVFGENFGKKSYLPTYVIASQNQKFKKNKKFLCD